MIKENNNLRILIAGGYGLIGSTAARHIRKINKNVEIILAGRNPEKGDALAEELRNAGTSYLDINGTVDPKILKGCDLIIEALRDPAGSLAEAAVSQGIAHIDITKLANEVSPLTFLTLKKSPKRPVVLSSHWQAGALTIIAAKAAEAFKHIDALEITAIYDERDPIGPMVAKEVGGFTDRALLRKNGTWMWADSEANAREIQLPDGSMVTGFPMAALDVPSLASVTGAPDVRFDFVQGESIGSKAGGKASHDLYIKIKGTLQSGEPAEQGTIISDPNGQSHLTALGILVATERILGLDGNAPPAGGLYLPETLI